MIQAKCCNRYQAPSIFLDLRKCMSHKMRASACSSAAFVSLLVSCTAYISDCRMWIRSTHTFMSDAAVRSRHAFLILQKGDLS